MTILDRSHLTGPAAWHFAGWPKSFFAVLGLLAAAWAEARTMERTAYRRHRFVDWS